jgi:putative oxidoreductase
MSVVNTISGVAKTVVTLTEGWVASFVNLALRLYVAEIFFKSGLTKIQSWDTTLILFEYEYAVPFISPELAAYSGTAAELILPVLLVIGLGGRFAAWALFVFNIMAVVSYPDLNEIGKVWHYAWGLALLIPMFYGPGILSIDHWLRRKFMSD